MTSSYPHLRGVIPIAVTPFAPDGSVDFDQFDREIDFLRSCGVEWVGFGFGSEVTRLAPGELSELMASAGKRGTGGMRVIGNAELTSAHAGTAAVRRVADAGAEMAMVRPSGLAGLPPDAVVETIAFVASHGGLPLVVQDAPQNTGVHLSAATLARLLMDVPEVVAVKVEPAAPAPKIGAIVAVLDGAPGAVIGGLGGQDFIHELQRGAVGTMPGPAFPEIFQAVQRHHDADDAARGFQVFARALPMITLAMRDADTFLVVQKRLLTRRGVLDGHALRPPHGPLDPHLVAEIDALVENIGLWDLISECHG